MIPTTSLPRRRSRWGLPSPNWHRALLIGLLLFTLLLIGMIAVSWAAPAYAMDEFVLRARLLPEIAAIVLLAWNAIASAGQPRRRVGWALLALAYGAAGVTQLSDLLNPRLAPFPMTFAPHDLGALLQQPLVLAALLLFSAPQPRARRSTTFWVDVGIVVVAYGMFTWRAMLLPLINGGDVSLGSAAMALVAVVSGMIAVVSMLTIVLRRQIYRTMPGLLLLALGLGIGLGGDMVQSYALAHRARPLTDLMTLLGLLSTVAVASAAFQAHRPIASPAHARWGIDRPLRWSRAIPYLGIASGYSVLFAATRAEWASATGPLLFGAALITLLAVLRQAAVNADDVFRATEQTTRQGEERFRALVQNASDIVMVLDASGMIRYLSPSLRQVLGFRPDDMVGTAIDPIIHSDDAKLFRSALTSAVHASGTVGRVDVRARHRDGSWRDLEVTLTNLLAEPHVSGIVANWRDVTGRKLLEARLAHQADHDPLTGLPNRTRFTERLEHALARPNDDTLVAVLLMDLDRFKVINDSLGHAVGDEILTIVALRLQDCVTSAATVARLGGDEFAILLERAPSQEFVTELAERILMAFRRPIHLRDRVLNVATSIGVTVSRPLWEDAVDVLRHADLALYQGKERGRMCYALYDSDRASRARSRLDLEQDLRTALERSEFFPVYQPIIDLASGAMVGCESLVRWQHPIHGIVSPSEFIALAEETGMIRELGERLLKISCEQLMVWQQSSASDRRLTMSVNLSARQIHQRDLPLRVARIIEETGIAPRQLQLELTESVLMEDAPSTLATLKALKGLGVKLAIDDFGTGYSSLSYLKRFPVDVLKIDRSFISDLGVDPEDTAIVQAVLTLAKTLGIEVVAEGVETAEQRTWLKALGCDLA